MKTIIGLVLIGVGAFLFVEGVNRKDSLAGAAASAGTNIANKIDGGVRTPQHVIYMVGGGALALVGAAILFRRSSGR
jgi:hypothetical protein